MSMIQELIEDLEKLKKWAVDEKLSAMSTREIENIIDCSIDTIKALSDKLHSANMQRSEQYYNGGWTSVNDMLPKDIEDVLVWYKARFDCGTHDGESFEYYGLGYYCKDGWSVTGINKSIYGKPEVIAWRPLPKEYDETK